METHPYRPYIPKDAKMLVLGSIPPWRFTIDDDPAVNKMKKLGSGDVDFYYGSRSNRFWLILSKIFKSGKLDSAEKIKHSLRNRKIAFSDVVHRCRRYPARSALDQNLRDIEFNHGIMDILIRNSSIGKILFTSSFVERIFYKYFPAEVERHENCKTFILQNDGRQIRTAILYSPSNMALRGIRQGKEFMLRSSQAAPGYGPEDFRIEQYKEHFME